MSRCIMENALIKIQSTKKKKQQVEAVLDNTVSDSKVKGTLFFQIPSQYVGCEPATKGGPG